MILEMVGDRDQEVAPGNEANLGGRKEEGAQSADSRPQEIAHKIL